MWTCCIVNGCLVLQLMFAWLPHEEHNNQARDEGRLKPKSWSIRTPTVTVFRTYRLLTLFCNFALPKQKCTARYYGGARFEPLCTAQAASEDNGTQSEKRSKEPSPEWSAFRGHWMVLPLVELSTSHGESYSSGNTGVGPLIKGLIFTRSSQYCVFFSIFPLFWA